MADFSNIKLNGTSYNCKDQTARNLISELQSALYPIGAIIHCTDCDTEAKVITKYGGSAWTRIQGKFLFACDDNHAIGTTGGSETNSHTHSVTANGTVGGHTLTTAELPAHNHSLNSHTHTIPKLTGSTNETGSHTHQIRSTTGGDTGAWINGLVFGPNNPATSVSSGAHSHTVTTNTNTTGQATGNTGNAGSDTAHNHSFTGSAVTSDSASDTNNMPPYQSVYIWTRTA